MSFSNGSNFDSFSIVSLKAGSPLFKVTLGTLSCLYKKPFLPSSLGAILGIISSILLMYSFGLLLAKLNSTTFFSAISSFN